jgi:hypothetical protein
LLPTPLRQESLSLAYIQAVAGMCGLICQNRVKTSGSGFTDSLSAGHGRMRRPYKKATRIRPTASLDQAARLA